jgi:hypothetical protein
MFGLAKAISKATEAGNFELPWLFAINLNYSSTLAAIRVSMLAGV